MQVKDVMHKGVVWVKPDTPLATIARKMRREDIGAVPIGENDRLVGMVTDRDICCRAMANRQDPRKMTARDAMSKPILYCRTNQDIRQAVRLMERKKIRRLPVINEKKRMVGILALGDVASKVKPNLAGEVMKAVSAHHR
ncbi:MAG: CBS domain-containing protein [Alphaproteobacteria bacterium]